MCLLICAPKGRFDDEEALRNGFESNHHGAGLAYAHNGVLHVKKGYFVIDQFLEEYAKIPKDAPNLVHFRLATSGKFNEENCHPFNVSKRLAFAHNGMFNCVHGNENHSDTYQFNEVLLKPLFAKNPHLVFCRAAQFLLQETIGNFNKIAFLNYRGETMIVNEKAGDWEGGVWFSNSSWRHAKRRDTIHSRSCSAIVQACEALQDEDRKALQNRGNGPKWRDFLLECYNEHLQGQVGIEA